MRIGTVAALACAISIALPAGALGAARALAPDPSYSYTSFDAGYLFAQGGGANVVDVGFGYRFNRHYAIESGYVGVFVGNVAVNGGYVDAYGYLPLGRRSRMSLFATAGASYVSSAYIGTTGYYASAFGVRGGGGVEWQLNDTWAMRATVRYQTTVIIAAVSTVGFTLRF